MELGLYEDSEVRLVRDRAANALRSISIDLNNNLDETSVALGIAKIADQISGTEGFKNKVRQDLKQIEQNENFKKNKAITDPIVKDFQTGYADRAIKTINEYLYNEKTDESLKKTLKELKEAMEEQIAKQGRPGSTPTMFTIWGLVGTKIYGDTLYLIFFLIPIIPISRWSLVNNGNGRFTFMGKLELTEKQKIWRVIGIIAIIVLVIIWIGTSSGSGN
jgi:hypothetical protein